MDRFSKILGGLLGAAVGDAMGAPTELRTTEQIKERFGGYVKDFVISPDDTFARGRKPGQVTDDFSMASYICRSIIDHNGIINDDVIKEAIINWGNDKEYYETFAGPTTRAAIEAMKKNQPTDIDPLGLVNYNGKATNGSAMKVSPIGLINIGNINKAIKDAVTASIPTHFNNLSIAGACAVTAAIAKAGEKSSSLDDIFDAAIYGASEGNKIGIEFNHIAAGPSVEKRIRWAVKLGKESRSFEELLNNISDYIGTGINVSESVPAVFGIIAGVNGDTMEGIYAGVNIGSDTDTIASMVGAILGTYNGYESFPSNYLGFLNEVNNIDIKKLAEELYRVVEDKK